MEQLFAHIFVAVITFSIVLIMIFVNSQHNKNDIGTEKYKGYISKISKPKILKNDLLVNWIYEYREHKSKEEWLKNKKESEGDGK